MEDVDIEKEEVLQEYWEDDDAASETDLEDSSGHATATHRFRGTVSILILDGESGLLNDLPRHL